MRHIRVASHVSPQPHLGRGGVGDGRGTRGSGGPKWHASVEPVFSLRACGARPSAEWPRDRDKAFRGQTRGRCEGRFSRRDALCASVWYGRPNVEAFHFHPMTRPRARGLRATCRGQARAIFCGRAEPAPPRDWSPELGWPSWESRGITRRAVFSEGRTLCVRVARPHASRSIPFPPDACARGRGPNGENPPRSQCRHCGRAEPAPPRGGLSELGRPSGANRG
jgi:hypothetical protein